jgi:N6-adenosine-specific RNA methylase IME4
MFVDIFNTTNKYNIIYADPPWTFKTYSDKGKDRSAENHYQVLSLEDIKNLPVKNITADDAVLFMWVTQPTLEKTFEVIKAWGFTYKTIGFIWVKQVKGKAAIEVDQLEEKDYRMNLGYWTRANGEICLLATKGKPQRINADVRQVVAEPLREHSRKPDCVRDKIVRLLGEKPTKIELFAREIVPNWSCWGNEVEKFK